MEGTMALDGIVIANITQELKDTLLGSRIYKIAQPETDELLITFKTKEGQYRLTLSANASLPLVCLTKHNKPSPMTAPNFCMLLRKHLNNGRVLSITQPGLERIIDIEVEHLNEMGDLCSKHLIVEIMGKHSNIIFCDNNIILDSIKHVSAQISSVREVLPGKPYFIPNTTDKLNPLEANVQSFCAILKTSPTSILKTLYQKYTGISPLVSQQICSDACINPELSANALDEKDQVHLYNIFSHVMDYVKCNQYTPNIYFDNDVPKDFASIPLSMFDKTVSYHSISELIVDFYSKKEMITRIRQKSSDLRRIVSNALERSYKKQDIQEKQINDTEKRDKFKVYGELINTYGYNIPEGSKSFKALNYYTNTEIEIPLDSTLTAKENAIKYFNKYNKLKRTYEAGSKQLNDTQNEIIHLESIATSLDIATSEEDLIQLKQELIDSGYIHKKINTKRKEKSTSKPFHYISSDGFDIYVGKNNYQNDELTFKFAKNDDWWFHAKQMAGSHVILKSEGKEIPDKTFEEAAALATYYSKGQNQEKVEVDYVLKKEVKKPAAAKPGFVVYYTNFSMMASTDIRSIKEAD